MNILYVSTMYPPSVGGAQIHLHCLARQMTARGHRATVITQSTSNRRDWVRMSTICPEARLDYERDGVRVRRMGFSWSSRLQMLPWALGYYAWMAAAVPRLSHVLEQHLADLAGNPSLVHISRIGREFLARAALDFARQRDIPVVFTANHHPRWHGALYRQYDRIYREVDAVLVLTEAEKELLVTQKGVRPDRIHVTGIGPVLAERFSAEEFRARFGIQDRFVLFLGQQVQYKGIDTIVAAAPEVWRRYPDVRFVFVGPPTEYSKRLFRGVRDERLVDLGVVDLETKTSALAACELLCLPSMQESFGGVFVEAWSLRKPVIGGRIPPIACVIDEGQDGLLSGRSPDELAAALDRLLSDPEGSRRMGATGWEKVQEHFTWPKIADKTWAVYQSLGVAVADPLGPPTVSAPIQRA